MIARQDARWLAAIVLAPVLALVMQASPASSNELKLESESYLIPSADPGIQLYIRNKHPAGMTGFAPERILLYVHGATYPSVIARLR